MEFIALGLVFIITFFGTTILLYLVDIETLIRKKGGRDGDI